MPPENERDDGMVVRAVAILDDFANGLPPVGEIEEQMIEHEVLFVGGFRTFVRS